MEQQFIETKVSKQGLQAHKAGCARPRVVKLTSTARPGGERACAAADKGLLGKPKPCFAPSQGDSRITTVTVKMADGTTGKVRALLKADRCDGVYSTAERARLVLHVAASIPLRVRLYLNYTVEGNEHTEWEAVTDEQTIPVGAPVAVGVTPTIQPDCLALALKVQRSVKALIYLEIMNMQKRCCGTKQPRPESDICLTKFWFRACKILPNCLHFDQTGGERAPWRLTDSGLRAHPPTASTPPRRCPCWAQTGLSQLHGGPNQERTTTLSDISDIPTSKLVRKICSKLPRWDDVLFPSQPEDASTNHEGKASSVNDKEEEAQGGFALKYRGLVKSLSSMEDLDVNDSVAFTVPTCKSRLSASKSDYVDTDKIFIQKQTSSTPKSGKQKSSRNLADENSTNDICKHFAIFDAMTALKSDSKTQKHLLLDQCAEQTKPNELVDTSAFFVRRLEDKIRDLQEQYDKLDILSSQLYDQSIDSLRWICIDSSPIFQPRQLFDAEYNEHGEYDLYQLEPLYKPTTLDLSIFTELTCFIETPFYVGRDASEDSQLICYNAFKLKKSRYAWIYCLRIHDYDYIHNPVHKKPRGGVVGIHLENYSFSFQHPYQLQNIAEGYTPPFRYYYPTNDIVSTSPYLIDNDSAFNLKMEILDHHLRFGAYVPLNLQIQKEVINPTTEEIIHTTFKLDMRLALAHFIHYNLDLTFIEHFVETVHKTLSLQSFLFIIGQSLEYVELGYIYNDAKIEKAKPKNLVSSSHQRKRPDDPAMIDKSPRGEITFEEDGMYFTLPSTSSQPANGMLDHQKVRQRHKVGNSANDEDEVFTNEKSERTVETNGTKKNAAASWADLSEEKYTVKEYRDFLLSTLCFRLLYSKADVLLPTISKKDGILVDDVILYFDAQYEGATHKFMTKDSMEMTEAERRLVQMPDGRTNKKSKSETVEVNDGADKENVDGAKENCSLKKIKPVSDKSGNATSNQKLNKSEKHLKSRSCVSKNNEYNGQNNTSINEKYELSDGAKSRKNTPIFETDNVEMITCIESNDASQCNEVMIDIESKMEKPQNADRSIISETCLIISDKTNVAKNSSNLSLNTPEPELQTEEKISNQDLSFQFPASKKASRRAKKKKKNASIMKKGKQIIENGKNKNDVTQQTTKENIPPLIKELGAVKDKDHVLLSDFINQNVLSKETPVQIQNRRQKSSLRQHETLHENKKVKSKVHDRLKETGQEHYLNSECKGSERTYIKESNINSDVDIELKAKTKADTPKARSGELKAFPNMKRGKDDFNYESTTTDEENDSSHASSKRKTSTENIKRDLQTIPTETHQIRVRDVSKEEQSHGIEDIDSKYVSTKTEEFKTIPTKHKITKPSVVWSVPNSIDSAKYKDENKSEEWPKLTPFEIDTPCNNDRSMETSNAARKQQQHWQAISSNDNLDVSDSKTFSTGKAPLVESRPERSDKISNDLPECTGSSNENVLSVVDRQTIHISVENNTVEDLSSLSTYNDGDNVNKNTNASSFFTSISDQFLVNKSKSIDSRDIFRPIEHPEQKQNVSTFDCESTKSTESNSTVMPHSYISADKNFCNKVLHVFPKYPEDESNESIWSEQNTQNHQSCKLDEELSNNSNTDVRVDKTCKDKKVNIDNLNQPNEAHCHVKSTINVETTSECEEETGCDSDANSSFIQDVSLFDPLPNSVPTKEEKHWLLLSSSCQDDMYAAQKHLLCDLPFQFRNKGVVLLTNDLELGRTNLDTKEFLKYVWKVKSKNDGFSDKIKKDQDNDQHIVSDFSSPLTFRNYDEDDIENLFERLEIAFKTDERDEINVSELARLEKLCKNTKCMLKNSASIIMLAEGDLLKSSENYDLTNDEKERNGLRKLLRSSTPCQESWRSPSWSGESTSTPLSSPDFADLNHVLDKDMCAEEKSKIFNLIDQVLINRENHVRLSAMYPSTFADPFKVIHEFVSKIKTSAKARALEARHILEGRTFSGKEWKKTQANSHEVNNYDDNKSNTTALLNKDLTDHQRAALKLMFEGGMSDGKTEYPIASSIKSIENTQIKPRHGQKTEQYNQDDGQPFHPIGTSSKDNCMQENGKYLTAELDQLENVQVDKLSSAFNNLSGPYEFSETRANPQLTAKQLLYEYKWWADGNKNYFVKNIDVRNNTFLGKTDVQIFKDLIPDNTFEFTQDDLHSFSESFIAEVFSPSKQNLDGMKSTSITMESKMKFEKFLQCSTSDLDIDNIKDEFLNENNIHYDTYHERVKGEDILRDSKEKQDRAEQYIQELEMSKEFSLREIAAHLSHYPIHKIAREVFKQTSDPDNDRLGEQTALSGLSGLVHGLTPTCEPRHWPGALDFGYGNGRRLHTQIHEHLLEKDAVGPDPRARMPASRTHVPPRKADRRNFRGPQGRPGYGRHGGGQYQNYSYQNQRNNWRYSNGRSYHNFENPDHESVLMINESCASGEKLLADIDCSFDDMHLSEVSDDVISQQGDSKSVYRHGAPYSRGNDIEQSIWSPNKKQTMPRTYGGFYDVKEKTIFKEIQNKKRTDLTIPSKSSKFSDYRQSSVQGNTEISFEEKAMLKLKELRAKCLVDKDNGSKRLPKEPLFQNVYPSQTSDSGFSDCSSDISDMSASAYPNTGQQWHECHSLGTSHDCDKPGFTEDVSKASGSLYADSNGLRKINPTGKALLKQYCSKRISDLKKQKENVKRRAPLRLDVDKMSSQNAVKPKTSDKARLRLLSKEMHDKLKRKELKQYTLMESNANSVQDEFRKRKDTLVENYEVEDYAKNSTQTMLQKSFSDSKYPCNTHYPHQVKDQIFMDTEMKTKSKTEINRSVNTAVSQQTFDYPSLKVIPKSYEYFNSEACLKSIAKNQPANPDMHRQYCNPVTNPSVERQPNDVIHFSSLNPRAETFKSNLNTRSGCLSSIRHFPSLREGSLNFAPRHELSTDFLSASDSSSYCQVNQPDSCLTSTNDATLYDNSFASTTTTAKCRTDTYSKYKEVYLPDGAIAYL